MNGVTWSAERLMREWLLSPFAFLSHAEPLKQSELGSHRFRIGDYRVVFGLEGQEIVTLRIGHRRDIYKR
jgi:mRNA interferase RelE/StbE